MFIIIGILYLFVGLVIGTMMCIHSGYNPNEPSSIGAIIAIGIIWPAILSIVVMRFVLTFTYAAVDTMIEWLTNNKQEREVSDE
jgi:Na+/melibiose symporter-like transporter